MNSSAASVIVLIHSRPSRRPGAVVLPAERDAALVERDEPAVADRDAVRVARQVGQHGLRPAERALGIDHPLGLPQRREVGREGAGVGQPGLRRRRRRAGRRSCSPASRSRNSLPEQPRQHPHGQEEARPAGDPARCRRRQAAARHDDVDVRVVGHGRAPGVEHGGEADPGARGAWGRPRSSAACRPPCGTAGRRPRPCCRRRWPRPAPAA